MTAVRGGAGDSPVSGRTQFAAYLLCLLLAGCASPRRLDILGRIPPFQLIDQTGRPFDSKSLAGHVWVADFFFTTCPGPCPMMSSKMHQVQVGTADMPDVKLVSFTVDPAHDTPLVLAAYSRHFLAQTGRWWFLTGGQDELNDLGLNAFHLNSVDGSLDHSTRFVLVDRKMQIRGYYGAFDEGALPRLIADIRQLERNPS
jgi:protein SCO1